MDPEQTSALLRVRLDEYAARWEQSMAKVRRSEYRAEDLLDDWFTVIGNVARDATAITTLMWSAAAEGRTSRDRQPSGGSSTTTGISRSVRAS